MPHPDDPREMMDELSAPIGDLIAHVGRSVAEAQQAIDAQTIENLRRLYADDDVAHAALRDIGYRPTWYHIPEATAEMSIALTISGQRESAGGHGGGRRVLRLYAAPVDATYTNKFDYDLKASSRITFRVVPVPPSSEVEGRRVVPILVGRTVAEARRLLEDLELRHDVPEGLADDDVVGTQTPEPGSLLEPGGAVALGGEGA